MNAHLNAETDRLGGACSTNEHSEGRKDTRAGSNERQLRTKTGQVTLPVTKRWDQLFETAIIERYRRALDAVRHVHKLINTGHVEILDADLTAYFDTLPYWNFSSRWFAGSSNA